MELQEDTPTKRYNTIIVELDAYYTAKELHPLKTALELLQGVKEYRLMELTELQKAYERGRTDANLLHALTHDKEEEEDD